MRYFTKEWFRSIQVDNLLRFTRIPDGEYSGPGIRALYKERLKKDIEELRELYGAPDDAPGSDGALDDDVFDERDARRRFFERYRHNIKTAQAYYPEWMLRSVDLRLIALELLPSSAYDRYEAECRAIRERNEAMHREFERVSLAENVPEAIDSALDLHDASLLSLRKSKRDLVMTVNKGWANEGDLTCYRRVTFKNAEAIERDRGLRSRRKCGPDGQLLSCVDFLYSEVYRRENGFEVHMMFFNRLKRSSLAYLTVSCSGVEYEDGASLSRPPASASASPN